ncbi:MAG: SgcJ/EcaC family oxidoreductase [Pyrinomonadaceae bacterium]|nr:SgcJ/EcaC family oxidoreductase [Pyrinomonadaceae bacterium]
MDEEAIRRVIAELADAWNSHDMDTWGMLFTDDADFVNRGGGWWKSNRENVEGHRAIHEMLTRRKQEMNFRLRADKISFLTPDIAIVHAMLGVAGFFPAFRRANGD